MLTSMIPESKLETENQDDSTYFSLLSQEANSINIEIIQDNFNADKLLQGPSNENSNNSKREGFSFLS